MIRFFLWAIILLCSQAVQAQTTAPATDSSPAEPLKKKPAGLGSFGGVMGGAMSFIPPRTPMISYAGSIAPEKNSPEVFQQRLDVIVPLYQTREHHFSMSITGAELKFGERLVLSDSNTLVPEKFYRSDMGLSYTHTDEKETTWGVRGSVGYATDKPFSNSRDMIFNLNATYSRPGEEDSRWIYFLFISNNSFVNYVPIPGFVYFYKTPTFIGMFGLPFISLVWMPVQPWSFMFSAFGPNITTEAIYSLGPKTQWAAGYSFSQQSYLRDNREDREDRIFFMEQRLYAAFRTPVSEKLMSELQVGHNFERRVFEGEGFTDDEGGEAALRNSWSLNWNLRYTF